MFRTAKRRDANRANQSLQNREFSTLLLVPPRPLKSTPGISFSNQGDKYIGPPWCTVYDVEDQEEEEENISLGGNKKRREGKMKGRAVDNVCSFCSTWSIIAIMFIAVCTRGALASVDITPAPEPAPETDGPPEFLFQIVAAGATFKAGEGSFDSVLTLENVNNETIAFSDRPERIAGTVPTDEFVLAAFATDDGPTDNSFFVDPPNAAFSCAAGPGEIARAVFKLQAPSESRTGGVSFEVDVLYWSDPEASLSCEGPVRLILF